MARISSGKNSKQDYQTPKEFITAVEKRFGKITLDLAARNYNKVCDKYIAPRFDKDGTPLPLDPDAYALDSLSVNWSELHEKLGGVFWLNCEFGKIPIWSAKCKLESAGTNITLLIPYGTTKAFIKNVLGKCDLYFLVGRLSFIPGESFPKDCVIAHYHSKAEGKVLFWDWKCDMILYEVH